MTHRTAERRGPKGPLVPTARPVPRDCRDWMARLGRRENRDHGVRTVLLYQRVPIQPFPDLKDYKDLRGMMVLQARKESKEFPVPTLPSLDHRDLKENKEYRDFRGRIARFRDRREIRAIPGVKASKEYRGRREPTAPFPARRESRAFKASRAFLETMGHREFRGRKVLQALSQRSLSHCTFRCWLRLRGQTCRQLSHSGCLPRLWRRASSDWTLRDIRRCACA